MSVYKNREDERKDRGRSKRAARYETAEWIAGHSLTLSKEEQEMVLEGIKTEQLDALEAIEDLANVGVKTSMKYDRKNDSYMVTLFRHETGLPDSGYTITARAKTFQRCVAALLFAIRDMNDFNLADIKEVREKHLDDF